MISLETLRRGPIQEQEAALTLLKDEQVRNALTAQIQAAIVVTREIRPLDEYPDEELPLFHASADKRLSIVRDTTGMIGLSEREHFQDLVIEVMRRYGLDINISKPKFTSGGWNHNGVTNDRDGTSRQILDYPSQTVRGLHFESNRHYYTATNEPISVSWSVRGHRLPFIEHFRRILPQAKIRNTAA